MRLKHALFLCGTFFALGGISGIYFTYEYFVQTGVTGHIVGKGFTYEYSGTVTRVIDGDTLEVDGERVRLALVDTPERGMSGFFEAAQFTASLCSVGSTAYIDVDDGQPRDKYGRVVAVVYCKGKNLNAELLKNGLAEIDERFIPISEFDPSSWR
jgi:endonuclease YncB( thermonuclease family)